MNGWHALGWAGLRLDRLDLAAHAFLGDKKETKRDIHFSSKSIRKHQQRKPSRQKTKRDNRTDVIIPDMQRKMETII